MKLRILILIFLMISWRGNSQRVLRSSDYSDPYLAGRINISLHDWVEIDESSLAELFGNLLQKQGFKSVEKRFPFAAKPEKKHTSTGERLADISKLFRIVINENVSIPEVLQVLRKCRYVKYAEPHFLPALCYVPNDDSTGIQYALSRINAFAAWDIQRGDTTVLIGITDTGHEPLHPDLNANIERNWADPVNGLDDDQDGYIDNFMGWDTGSEDNNPAVDESYHGIHVTGLCCAVTDNQTGMAGTGFNSRYFHIKIANNQGILTGAYEGLIYAADHGCKVINCSWGGNQYSEINEELIRYAAVNKNAVVICGAGNNNNERLFYPAAYPYALSIASTDVHDSKPEFSNYGYAIGMVAPGDYVLSTWANGAYVRSGGTSMSAPVVAGAAALIRASFPQWNSRQVVEQLKISADQIDTLPQNAAWKNKMGSGRLNMLRALTQSGKSAIVLQDIQAESTGEGLFLPGDTVSLSGLLVNYLAPVNAVKLSMSSESDAVSFINPERQAGAFQTLASVSLDPDPFLIIINPEAEINENVVLRLQIEADGFTRNQYIFLRVYSDFINVETTELKVSFGSDGTVGPVGSGFIKGNGFRFKSGEQLLYEGGLMIGVPGRGVVDNIRGSGGDRDELITSEILSRRSLPDASLEEFRGSFISDDPLLQLNVEQRVIVSKAFVHRNFMIAEYHLINNSADRYEGLFAGMFCDWDLADPGANIAGWQADRRLGYVHTLPDDTLFTATQLLGTVPVNYYAIDNIPGGSGGLNLSDGFTDEEKFQAMSVFRPTAGNSPGGSDVITVLSAGPFDLDPEEGVRIAFAFHAGSSPESLNQSTLEASDFYRQTAGPLLTYKNKSQSGVFIFPNPASHRFRVISDYVETPVPPVCFDLQGRQVHAEIVQVSGGWEVQVDKNLTGLIILKVRSAEGWQFERVLLTGNE